MFVASLKVLLPMMVARRFRTRAATEGVIIAHTHTHDISEGVMWVKETWEKEGRKKARKEL